MSIDYAVHDAVATITLNRPKARNALSPTLLRELVARLADAERDDTVRVVVLTGAGERVFSSGADLKAMGGDLTPYQRHTERHVYVDVLRAIREIPKPVIARVNGDVLAGGMGVLLACDLAVAEERCRFSLPEVKIGLFPMMVAALLLRHMPRKKATRLMLTGEKLSAADAERFGLISDLVPDGQLDEATASLAGTIASRSPLALRHGLAAMRAQEEMPLDDALEFLHGQLNVLANTEDALEGVMAFFEKRTPQWTGR